MSSVECRMSSRSSVGAGIDCLPGSAFVETVPLQLVLGALSGAGDALIRDGWRARIWARIWASLLAIPSNMGLLGLLVARGFF